MARLHWLIFVAVAAGAAGDSAGPATAATSDALAQRHLRSAVARLLRLGPGRLRGGGRSSGSDAGDIGDAGNVGGGGGGGGGGDAGFVEEDLAAWVPRVREAFLTLEAAGFFADAWPRVTTATSTAAGAAATAAPEMPEASLDQKLGFAGVAASAAIEAAAPEVAAPEVAAPKAQQPARPRRLSALELVQLAEVALGSPATTLDGSGGNGNAEDGARDTGDDDFGGGDFSMEDGSEEEPEAAGELSDAKGCEEGNQQELCGHEEGVEEGEEEEEGKDEFEESDEESDKDESEEEEEEEARLEALRALHGVTALSVGDRMALAAAAAAALSPAGVRLAAGGRAPWGADGGGCASASSHAHAEALLAAVARACRFDWQPLALRLLQVGWELWLGAPLGSSARA